MLTSFNIKSIRRNIRAYPALYVGGTPSQETGTSTPSCLLLENRLYMSRKGPYVGQGMLDFVEDCCLGVKSH